MLIKEKYDQGQDFAHLEILNFSVIINIFLNVGVVIKA